MRLPLIIFLVFIFTFQHTQAQVMETSTDVSPQKNYNFYSLKQKRQKTVAWICFGSGLAMTITGLVINSADEVVTATTLGLMEVEKEHGGDWLIYLGGATTLTSIPFFISAGKNKRKAALSLKGEPLSFRNLSNKMSQHMSIALTIEF